MALFNKLPEDAIFICRDDTEEPLASFSHHEFELDGLQWPSVEHYFQAMKFADPALKEKIRSTPHPKIAQKTARWQFWKVRKDWKDIQRSMMTRGTWIKCHAYPAIAQKLLETDERMIVESSLYDHYWGCGRDQRGHNYYGKMLMDVRNKLRQEAMGQAVTK